MLMVGSYGEEGPMTDGQPELIWRKSRSCASNACVEVASAGVRFLVRDSDDPDGRRLSFDAAGWASFVGALKRADDDFTGLSARVE